MSDVNMEQRVELKLLSAYANSWHEVDETMVRCVNRARQAGCTWGQIGQALGVTQQAALQRFGKKVEKIDLRSDHSRYPKNRFAWRGDRE